MSRGPYHTALRSGRVEAAPPVGRFEISRGGVTSVAFVHNMEAAAWAGGLPPEYADCDVLYGDPPWPAGYAEFNRRAGSDGAGYRFFAGAVDYAMVTCGVPGVIVAGPTFLTASREAKLAYRQTRRTRLNGEPALAVLYGVDVPDTASSEELLAHLAGRFRRVGDFVCGYGRSGRVFAGAGGSFVMSDSNASCVGYVAAHAAEWFPGEGK